MIDLYLENAKGKEVSSYAPGKDVMELLLEVKKYYTYSYNLQHKPFRFFNDLSVLQRQNVSQRIFNLYEEPEPKDPDLKWRERSRRPLSRNKTISIAAHLITSLIYPHVFAQDKFDEEDKAAAELMRTMILYNIDNSDYEMSMLFGIIAACVNPCLYLSVDYIEALQEIKEENDNGDISTNDVIDTVLSGMQIEPIPIEEMLIANIWQQKHQKQMYRIKKRLISYDEAEAKYGQHDDWKHVRLGVQTVWDSNDSKFYQVEESERDHLVEELEIQIRRRDLQVTFVGGIYMGDDDVKANLMQHRDNDNRPWYPEDKTGYEPYDEKKFYYYKSLVEKLWPDQKRLDKMHRLASDGTYLAALIPLAAQGVNRKIDRSVMFPGQITQIPKDATIKPIAPGMDLNALYNQIVDAESSMNKSSQDDIRQGVSTTGNRTKFEISRIEFNSIVKEFAIFGRMIGNLVESVGNLMVHNIVRFQTVLDPEELFSGFMRLQARQFLVPNEVDQGKSVTKKITFSDELIGEKMTKEEKLAASFKLMTEEEDKGGNVRITKADPQFVSKMKYKIVIKADQKTPRSQEFEEERKLAFRDKLITSPMANIESVERDFLFDVAAPGQADKYMKKAEQLGLVPPGGGAEKPAKEITSNLGVSSPALGAT